MTTPTPLRHLFALLTLAAAIPAAQGATAKTAADAPLRLNDIQVIGTHNSYKNAISPEVLKAIAAATSEHVAQSLDYAHRPLTEQLDRGARQLELDVYYDPNGGYYAGHSTDPELLKPGFKVLHIAGVDNSSSCLRLVQCLQILKTWSDAHPQHVPIMLMFNAKDEQYASRGGIDALPFTTAAFDALDAEIRSVLPSNKLITPDDVQGSYPSLRDAVLADHWPTLAQARGHFLFALDEHEAKVALYRGQRHSLEGRVFFVNTDESSPAAAYLTINDPIAEAERIRRDVKAGFLVRTRADSDTWEARANDTRRRTAAFASGAQYVSTDYLWPDPRLGNDYQVQLPDSVAAVCNPVRQPQGCNHPIANP